MIRQTLLILLALSALSPAAADAQFGASADLMLRSRHVWRGVTRATRPVIQPALLLSWLPRGWTVTAGGWANVEPFPPDPADRTDAGRGGGVAEIDYWVEAHTRVRQLDVRAGHIWYDLRGHAMTTGPGSGWDTAELYAAVTFLPTRLTGITGAFYWDYETIDGGFATIDVFRHVPLVQVQEWIFTLTPAAQAGVSLGQALDASDPEQLGYFVNDGLSYALVSAAVYAMHPTWSPYFATSVQYNRDAATRVNRLGEEGSRLKAWIDLGVTYTVGSRPRAR